MSDRRPAPHLENLYREPNRHATGKRVRALELASARGLSVIVSPPNDDRPAAHEDRVAMRCAVLVFRLGRLTMADLDEVERLLERLGA